MKTDLSFPYATKILAGMCLMTVMPISFTHARVTGTAQSVTFSTSGIAPLVTSGGHPASDAEKDAKDQNKKSTGHSDACAAKGKELGQDCTPKGTASSDPDSPTEYGTTELGGTTYATAEAHWKGECDCKPKKAGKKIMSESYSEVDTFFSN